MNLVQDGRCHRGSEEDRHPNYARGFPWHHQITPVEGALGMLSYMLTCAICRWISQGPQRALPAENLEDGTKCSYSGVVFSVVACVLHPPTLLKEISTRNVHGLIC